MEKILSWLNDFKSYFSSEVSKISNAQAELATVKAEFEKVSGELKGANEKISTLEASLSEASEKLGTAEASAKDANEKAAAAEKNAQEVLAAQGLSSEDLPAASDESSPKESAFTRYSRLVSEGRNQDAARFYAANTEAIFKSRNK